MASADLILNGVDDVFRFLKRAPAKLQFAFAKAANDTAKDVQEWTVNELLPGKFTLRTKWMQPKTRFGFNIRFASAKNATAIIGSQADWLKAQERGGNKPKKNEAGNIAIPSDNLLSRQTNRPRAREEKPKRLLQSKKAFWRIMKSGKVGLFLRPVDRTGSIKLLYTLQHSIHINPVLGFESDGAAFADLRFPLRLQAAVFKELSEV